MQKQQTPAAPSIFSSKEFCESLYGEFSQGKVWRTSEALAKKLNVDVVELDNYLRGQQVVCCKPSKDEGVFLYALIKRLEVPPQNKDATKVEAQLRPLVSEEDRYCLGSIHSALILLEAALQKYALKIHERNPEAFTSLVAGKDKIEAGMVLYANKLKADLFKLPKV